MRAGKLFGGLHRETVARRKASAMPGWEPCILEVIGTDAVSFTGAVPVVGPRGEKKYPEPRLTVVVTDGEAIAEAVGYEEQTGKCADCLGTCEIYAGWSAATGVRKQQCDRCVGTGVAPGATTQAAHG